MDPSDTNDRAMPPERTGLRPFARRQAWVGLILFGVAFSAVNLALEATHWTWFPPWIQRDYDYYQAHMSELDLIFIGSSFTKRQIDPRVFDRELARSGHSLRSANLATLGMTFFGSDLLARRIVALRGKRLKWIVIDLGSFGVSIAPGAAYTSQAFWWHTPLQTANALDASFAGDLPMRRRFSLAWPHLVHGLWHFTHLGMGAELLDKALSDLERGTARSAKIELSERGFMPHRGAQSRAFVRSRRLHEDAVRKAQRGGRWSKEASDIYLPFLLEQADWLRDRGVEPVYVIPPIMEEYPDTEDFADEVQVFRYNDPVEHAELFAFTARRDRRHLLEHAAHRYTRLLARDFEATYAGVIRENTVGPASAEKRSSGRAEKTP